MTASPLRSSVSFRRRLTYGAVVIATGVGVLLVSPAGAQAETATAPTTANIIVSSAITLTGLPASFTMAGIPGDVVNDTATPVTMTVKTNNTAGYTVTVQAAAPNLVGTLANTDVIPIAALTVREGVTGAYTPMSNTAPFVAHTQAAESLEDGDLITNSFALLIPFVHEDTYSATLNYIATTL